MILVALENAGGAKYLERQAHANPVAFMGLIGKLLPTQLRAGVEAGDGSLVVQIDWAGPDRLSYADPAPVEALVQDVVARPVSGPLEASPGPSPVEPRRVDDAIDDLL